MTDPANWCLSFESARGLFRVRTPNQVVETTFGQVLGRDEFRTAAAAVADINVRGEGGILPFGIPFGSGDGGHLCLSSAPSGLALDPCTGGASGNFGVLKGRKFGNPDIPTTANCTASPLNTVLAQNIAHGLDHLVIPDDDGDVTNETRDQCFNPLVDTLNTDTGFSTGTELGLMGPVSGGYTPRLAQSPTTIAIDSKVIDDRPLWDYLNNTADYGATALPTFDDAPAICAPSTFNGGSFDWDGDLLPDPNRSWQHMAACIDAYRIGGYMGVMFLSTLITNEARFAYIPEFHESSLGTGSSWLHILRFRATYLQTTLWKKGPDYVVHSPGEQGGPIEHCFDLNSQLFVQCPTGTQFRLWQLTAFVLPHYSLPAELRGDFVTPGSGVNPFTIELFK